MLHHFLHETDEMLSSSNVARNSFVHDIWIQYTLVRVILVTLLESLGIELTRPSVLC
jgi:hypothetical protein